MADGMAPGRTERDATGRHAAERDVAGRRAAGREATGRATAEGPIRPVAAFQRIGEENAFRVLARADALRRDGRDIINLGIGQPDFPTPEHVCEAAIRAIRDGAHGYTPAPGTLECREAVSRRIRTTTGVEVSPDAVLIVPGGKITMHAAIQMLGEPGADILYPDPGFPIYRSMIEFTGARPVPVPMESADGLSPTAEGILSRLTPATRLVIVNSPGNPTGGVMPRAEVDALAAGLAERPDVAILSDEIYRAMTYDGVEAASLLLYPELRDRLIVLDGWSKTWAMTGWRLGWGVWPPALVDAARKLAVNAWSCVNAPAQAAAIAAIDGPQDAAAAMMEAFARRRRLIVDGLDALPGIACSEPMGAFYAFPDVAALGVPARELANRWLEEAGVATVGGPDFGTLGEGRVRFSFAASEAEIERALERLGAWLSRNG